MEFFYTTLLILHIIVSLFLIIVILLQSGRGGLGEALGGAAAQSMFGGGVSTVVTKATAFCAALFIVTCVSLAKLSTIRGQSVVDRIPAELSGVIAPILDPNATTAQPAASSEEASPATEPAD